jgi:hypothetical protein
MTASLQIIMSVNIGIYVSAFSCSCLMSLVQAVQVPLGDVTSSDGLAAIMFCRELRGFSFSYVMSRVRMV